MIFYFPQIGLIHPDQEVELVVVLVSQLAGCFAGTADPMLGQLAAGHGIDQVADFLGAGSCGLDVKSPLQTNFFHQILHHQLGYWTPTYIPMTDKKQFRHCCYASNQCGFLQYSTPYLGS